MHSVFLSHSMFYRCRGILGCWWSINVRWLWTIVNKTGNSSTGVCTGHFKMYWAYKDATVTVNASLSSLVGQSFSLKAKHIMNTYIIILLTVCGQIHNCWCSSWLYIYYLEEHYAIWKWCTNSNCVVIWFKDRWGMKFLFPIYVCFAVECHDYNNEGENSYLKQDSWHPTDAQCAQEIIT